MPAAGNKPGRRSYGARTSRTVRYPQEYDAIFESIADEAGIHIGTWLALAACQQAGLDVPDYVKDELRKAARERAARQTEQELEMPRSA